MINRSAIMALSCVPLAFGVALIVISIVSGHSAFMRLAIPMGLGFLAVGFFSFSSAGKIASKINRSGLQRDEKHTKLNPPIWQRPLMGHKGSFSASAMLAKLDPRYWSG
jgi:hypothetical protein